MAINEVKPDFFFVLLFLIQDFRREGNDLYIVQRIGLVEALCGFQMTVTHLDGRQLLIKYPPGKIIEPGNHEFIEYIFHFQQSSTHSITDSVNKG